MEYLRLTVNDTLGFWDDYLEDYAFNPQNSKSLITWYRLPEGWFGESGLLPERTAALLGHLYGENWQMGNGDGSKYVVLNLETHRLEASEAASRPWETLGGSCYVLGEAGTFVRTEPSVF